MYTKGDFHLHTNASDGNLSPSELANMAKEKGFDIISITDHDTTKSIPIALEYSVCSSIKIIPGIELSTLHSGESVHILGYFKDSSYNKPSFQLFLQNMYDYRLWRGKKMVENLNTFFNIKLDYDKILKEARGIIARPHLAKSIVENGYTHDWEYIFKKLLSESSPAFVPNKKVSIEEGIDLLKSVNSLVVLAHPVLIKKSNIEDLIKFPFDGIEAIYALNNPSDTEKYINLANKHNKLITAGSDFHGIVSNDTKHGTIGCVSLSSEHINKFLNRLNKL